jgi:gamma-glutamyltranspeptidase/glutathione hydrolase
MEIRTADPHHVPNWTCPRYPVVARDAMVASSQPLATHAALDVLAHGGNAVDAVITAAAMLCVLEPMWTGIGGDCFAIVWDGHKAIGLDAAGPAPMGASAADPVEIRGPRSITVPGSVAGWEALSQHYGKLELGRCLERAVRLAETGFPVSPIVAWHWGAHQAPQELMPVPKTGQRFPMPALAHSLRRIAAGGAAAFYQGSIASAIAQASWLTEDDLAAYRPQWVEPLSASYRGVGVLELPPPTQGVAVLEALKLLEREEPTLNSQIRAMQLALEDAQRCVRDGADVAHLLDPGFLATRLNAAPADTSEPAGGTIYVCAVDPSGMAVSFIQSLYMPFGSRVFAKDTGILLQNRGACFSVSGAYSPGRRPFHTTIPALLLKDGHFFGALGVVGGFVQAQAHLQVISHIVDRRNDPQEALDRPRFFIDKDVVRLGAGLVAGGRSARETWIADRPAFSAFRFRRRASDLCRGRNAGCRLRLAQGWHCLRILSGGQVSRLSLTVYESPPPQHGQHSPGHSGAREARARNP